MLAVEIIKYSHINDNKTFFENSRFEIQSNGLYLLTGVSGIGKSTLMKIIIGINDGVFEGHVKFTNNNIVYTNKDFRNSGLIGYQADESSLLPWKTIEENLLLPQKLNPRLKSKIKPDLKKELEMLGLNTNVLSKYPDELSFGMKSRIGIIYSFLWSPLIVFLDELFSGIDIQNNLLVSEYLKAKKQTCIIIAISHQIEQALTLSDGVIVINKNREIFLTNKIDKNFILSKLN